MGGKTQQQPQQAVDAKEPGEEEKVVQSSVKHAVLLQCTDQEQAQQVVKVLHGASVPFCSHRFAAKTLSELSCHLRPDAATPSNSPSAGLMQQGQGAANTTRVLHTLSGPLPAACDWDGMWSAHPHLLMAKRVRAVPRKNCPGSLVAPKLGTIVATLAARDEYVFLEEAGGASAAGGSSSSSTAATTTTTTKCTFKAPRA